MLCENCTVFSQDSWYRRSLIYPNGSMSVHFGADRSDACQERARLVYFGENTKNAILGQEIDAMALPEASVVVPELSGGASEHRKAISLHRDDAEGETGGSANVIIQLLWAKMQPNTYE